ncbi:MAG TPA: hypothetical protein VEY09_14320 [Pyrinomonadaceae bacterium]|nr:hypothetical protein [Pyrinomonadaceae bacterium]
MNRKLIQGFGVVWTCLLASAVVWLYATAPASVAEVATRASVTVGTYQIDRERFEEAHGLFRRGQYRAARDEWERADPARRDALTQFYVAYSLYREGWGRVYNDDELFRLGLEAAERAIRLSPGGTLKVDDPDLKIKNAPELKAELQQGLERTASDFNPLRVFRERK